MPDCYFESYPKTWLHGLIRGYTGSLGIRGWTGSAGLRGFQGYSGSMWRDRRDRHDLQVTIYKNGML